MYKLLAAIKLICLFVCLAPVAAQEQCTDPDRTLLWHIPGKQSDVYLFGSIHVGNPGFYPLPDRIESTYRNAEHIVFEIDPRVAASAEIALQIQARAVLPEGVTLREVLSTDVLNDLVMTLTSLGLPPASFMNFQPWYLTLLLTNLQTAMLGYLPMHGIEAYLIRQMPEGADILELESIQKQISFLEELNGESYLAYTLLGFEDASERIDTMIQAWECADQEKLEEIIFSIEEDAEMLPELDQLMEKLFFERNAIMAGKVREYLEAGTGDYFIVVGAGHLVGERSVLDLLDEQYPVTNIRLD